MAMEDRFLCIPLKRLSLVILLLIGLLMTDCSLKPTNKGC